MAPARRARSPNASQSLYADETDQESEPETPRPHKSHLKKRLSEVYNPENDASFTSDGGRVPLRTVNINDDAAEKRRRRKSTKITVLENALAGPSSEGAHGQPEVADHSRPARQTQQLNTVAPPILENVPLDVMSSNFESWMKMATDNKINAANSWNFALIDYFHDMSLLRNDDDNSINFQRASCTLDGCVKIWTSRVDSVGTETGKLLSNLESGGHDAGDDDENSDNPDADPSQTKKRKTNRAAGSTLAKDPSVLKQKKPDLEFAVDPLYRKTCADFDEGGAGGLLMNHLSLGIGSEGCMRVIFDGSDPMGKVEEEEVIEEPESMVNLSELRKYIPDLSILDDKAISHSLAGFSFSKDAFVIDDTTFFQDDTRDHDGDDDDDGDNNDFGMNMDLGDGPPVEDFFVGADAVGDDYGGDMGGDDYGGDNQSNNGSAGANEENARPGPFVPFDPRRLPSERDMVLAMTDGDSGALDYFDQNFLKNWAGPEHWKLRRNVRKPEADSAGGKATKRQKKEAIKIDFLTPAEKSLKELTAELFAPVTKGVGINLPGTGKDTAKKGRKKKEKRDDHRLPDDMHFSSRQLVTLFLKPKFFLKMRGKRVKMNDNGDGEVDENFWAQAAADQAANRDHDDDDDDGNGGPAPFNTQFFHEDDFGPGFDDDPGFDVGVGGLPEEDAGEQDLLAATQGQTRRVRPEFVNYARRAKRVDVRKLKENIWKGLDIVVKKEPLVSEDQDDSMDVDDENAETPTDPSEARQFSQVISGLQRSYPRDKMEEISTSFCFICLLHLANEQGLKLESAMQDLRIVEDEPEDVPASDEKKIGNIWDIKIYRDPNATQAA